MKRILKLLTLILLVNSVISCSKDDSSPAENDNNVNVYVVGTINNTTSSSIAKLWKDGVVSNLSNGSTYARANAVFVDGIDVYVAGSQVENQHSVAKIWKNGIAGNLTNVLGYTSATAYSVVVEGGNVYACGQETNDKGIYVAKYWVNGDPISLTNGLENAFALSIVVKNGNVYVVGRALIDGFTIACLWTNGVLTELTNGNYFGSATSVFVEGNDVYVAGFEESSTIDVAKIWKNGVSISLSENESYAEYVKVVNGNTYAVGWEHISGKDVATLWKNGKATYWYWFCCE